MKTLLMILKLAVLALALIALLPLLRRDLRAAHRKEGRR